MAAGDPRGAAAAGDCRFGPAAPGRAEAAGPPVSRPVPAPEPKQRPQAALAPFDRRLKQRLARGVVAIDAVLDLHGLGLRDAHAALLSFVHRARTSDARVVWSLPAKGKLARPGCCGSRCRSGSARRGCASTCSRSRRPIGATAGRAPSMYGSGAAGRTRPRE